MADENDNFIEATGFSPIGQPSSSGSEDPASFGLVEVTGEFNPLPIGASGIDANSPIQESPVSSGDRFRLSFGNQAGSVKFLKDKFEDAQINQDGELVVKDQGFWKTVDPSGLGDTTGWDFADKVAKKGEEGWRDLLDLSSDLISVLAVGAGAVAGTGAGAGGTIGGATVAAGIASASNSSLGRWLGTYDAAPVEQFADAALDMAFTAGGYAILPVGKIAGKWLGKGLQKQLRKLGIKSVSTSPEADLAIAAIQRPVQQQTMPSRVMSGLIVMAGANPRAAELMVERAGMIGIVKAAWKKIGSGQSFSKVSDGLSRMSEKFMARGVKEAEKQFEDQLIPLMNKSFLREAASLTINAQSISRSVASQLGDVIGRTVTKKGLTFHANRLSNVVLNDLTSGLGFQRSMKQLIPLLNGIERLGTMRGQNAGLFAMKLNKIINNMITSSGGDLKKRLINVKGLIRKDLDRQIGTSSTNALAAWNARNSYIESVKQSFKQLAPSIRTGSGKAATINALVSDPLRDNATISAIQQLRSSMFAPPQLQGLLAKGSSGLRRISRAEEFAASREFLKILPKRRGLTTFDLPVLGAIGGGLGVAGALAAGIPLAILSSPRMQARVLRLSARFNPQVANSAAAFVDNAMTGAAQRVQALKGELLAAGPQRAALIEGIIARITSSIAQEQAELGQR